MKQLLKTLSLLTILLSGANLHAKKISGVTLAEQIELGGQSLSLNGAGIRSKFIFDIYIGALYLPQKTNDIALIMTMAGPRRVLMHVLYEEVEAEKLTNGWTEGFKNNLPKEVFAILKSKLEAFNALFQTVKAGDQIFLDYIPEKGTQVTINEQLKGSVAGKDFYQALLMVWLGKEPADSNLKEAMLGH